MTVASGALRMGLFVLRDGLQRSRRVRCDMDVVLLRLDTLGGQS
jgi:hypothetical protein